MVQTCCVKGCSNRFKRGNGISFFHIPAIIKDKGNTILEITERRRRLWLKNINRKTVTYDTVKFWTRVCSKHFISGKPATLIQEHSPDWAPTLHMGYQLKSIDRPTDRFTRNENRKLNVSLTEHQPDNLLEDTPPQLTNDQNTQTDQDPEINLREDKSVLQQNNAPLFTESFFEASEEKVRLYTGLPNFRILMALFQFLSSHIPMGPRSSLTKFQALILVFVRLRFNLPFGAIGDLFSVSEATSSRTFLKMIDIMFVRLQPLIHWPEREYIKKTMPTDFVNAFGNKVAAIIDCFEIYIEKPSSLLARAQTFSSYKHHNTIKYLIAITPQGCISFISQGWGGRCSDKYITENSTFLENLLPGDLILADRGFNIQESVGIMCAEVKIPAFTKGKKQLSAFDVEGTRKIAHLRIHVERVIGNLIQKYPINNSIVSIPMLSVAENDSHTTLDKIVHVCCALVNLCPSVVPFQ